MLGNVSDLIMKTRPWLILISKYKLIGLIISESAELPLNCPGFNSRWEQCKNRALHLLQGMVNGVPSLNDLAIIGTLSKHNQPTNQSFSLIVQEGVRSPGIGKNILFFNFNWELFWKYFTLEIWSYIHVWDKNKTSINVRLYKEK